MTFDRAAQIRSLSADIVVVGKRRATMIDRHGVKWTSEMDAALTEMAKARCGYRIMASRIGVCGEQILARRAKLGLPHGRPGRKAVQ